ncbi:Uncharacterised protein [Clostridioides difficile]|nr:Uncharacterised protein [Clostridioides difficile]
MVEAVGGQRQHMCECIAPECGEKPLGDPGAQIVVGSVDHRGQQVERDVDPRDGGEWAEIGRHQHIVDESLEQCDLGDGDQRGDHRQREAGEQPPPDGTKPWRERAKDLQHSQSRGVFHERSVMVRGRNSAESDGREAMTGDIHPCVVTVPPVVPSGTVLTLMGVDEVSVSST